MAIDINNHSGTTSGTQNLGVIVQKVGKGTQEKDTTSIGEKPITAITGQWSERFDDPTYYS